VHLKIETLRRVRPLATSKVRGRYWFDSSLAVMIVAPRRAVCETAVSNYWQVVFW